MPELDHWLTQLFDPEHIDDTVAAMVDAGSRDEAFEARAESARGGQVDCDQRLTKQRAALDAGADLVVAAGWTAVVQGERVLAEAELATTEATGGLSEAEVRRLVLSLGSMAQVLS